jgi:hypothetical protein
VLVSERRVAWPEVAWPGIGERCVVWVMGGARKTNFAARARGLLGGEVAGARGGLLGKMSYQGRSQEK